MYKILDLGPGKAFTVQSRGVFTQEKSGHFFSGKAYGENGTGEKCSL